MFIKTYYNCCQDKVALFQKYWDMVSYAKVKGEKLILKEVVVNPINDFDNVLYIFKLRKIKNNLCFIRIYNLSLFFYF